MTNKPENGKIKHDVKIKLLERRLNMRILAVCDIVGESGVLKLKEELPRIKREENIDFVITNG